MDAIEKAIATVEKRLDEIRDEESMLEAGLYGRKGGGQRRNKPRTRAARGQREKQLLASIKKHPNYRQADHAKAIGVGNSQVYGLVKKLSKKGKVKKSHDGTLALV